MSLFSVGLVGRSNLHEAVDSFANTCLQGREGVERLRRTGTNQVNYAELPEQDGDVPDASNAALSDEELDLEISRIGQDGGIFASVRTQICAPRSCIAAIRFLLSFNEKRYSVKDVQSTSGATSTAKLGTLLLECLVLLNTRRTQKRLIKAQSILSDSSNAQVDDQVQDPATVLDDQVQDPATVLDEQLDENDPDYVDSDDEDDADAALDADNNDRVTLSVIGSSLVRRAERLFHGRVHTFGASSRGARLPEDTNVTLLKSLASAADEHTKGSNGGLFSRMSINQVNSGTLTWNKGLSELSVSYNKSRSVTKLFSRRFWSRG